MGAFIGKSRTATTLSDDKHENSKKDLEFLNTNNMQNEFDDIYKRSNLILMSLVKNPAKELEDRIFKCLKDNPLNMETCLEAMDSAPKMGIFRNDVGTEDAALKMLESAAVIKEN